MPCTTNIDKIVKSSNLSASSACIDTVIANEVNLQGSSALMFGSSKVDSNFIVDHGYINSPYIILSTRCDYNFGDAKITGKVFYVAPEHFNNIYWTWSNSSMLSYMQKNNIVGVQYNNEKMSDHLIELVNTTNNYDAINHFDNHHYNNAFYKTITDLSSDSEYYRDKYSEASNKYENMKHKYEELEKLMKEANKKTPYNPTPVDFPKDNDGGAGNNKYNNDHAGDSAGNAANDDYSYYNSTPSAPPMDHNDYSNYFAPSAPPMDQNDYYNYYHG